MPGPDREPLTAAILAGGVSHRLGRDKALVTVGGMPIAERVRRSLLAVTDRIFVVGKVGERNPLPDLPFVTDAHPVRCALAGLVKALETAGAERVLVVGCDHPFLAPPLLELLAVPGRAAVRLTGDPDRPEPLLGCWNPSVAYPVLRQRLEDGSLSLTGAIAALESEVIPPEEVLAVDRDLLSFLNVNTPEDLIRAESVLENY